MKLRAIEGEKERSSQVGVRRADAPFGLGVVLSRSEGRAIVRTGGMEIEVAIDEAVDRALIDEAIAHKSRVMLEDDAIVGVLATRRAVTIDAQDRVHAKVKSFEVDAADEVLLRVPGAFVQARAQEIELYAGRVLTRARDMAKILAAMIKLN